MPKASEDERGGNRGANLTRDQRRAIHAYRCVGEIARREKSIQKEYEIAINDLGATILRGGLAAAMARLERLGDKGDKVLEHLARADIPGLESGTARELPRIVRQLDVDDYIMATRETLQMASWLKRAAQAMLGDS